MKNKAIKISLIVFIISFNLSFAFTQLKVLSNGEVTIPLNKSLWITNSTNPGDAGYRLRMHNNGSNAYIDYYNSLYFRAGYSTADNTVTFTSTGKVSIGTTNTSYGKLQINGSGYPNGLSVYNGSGTAINIFHNSDDNAYITRGSSTSAGIRLLNNGHVGINGYASSNYWFYVTGDCRADSWSTYSDSTAKTDIKDISNSERIKELRPVTFLWKEKTTGSDENEGLLSSNNTDINDAEELCDSCPPILSDKETIKPEIIPEIKDTRIHYGFLAQDVQELYPDIVTSDEEGRLAIEYDAFIPLLVDCYKNLVLKLDTLENIISIQNDEIADLRTKLNGEAEKKSANETIKEETPALFQNIPNPFNVNTEIKYFLPENTTSASINIYDLNGRPIKRIDINETGMSRITIHGAELKPGMYLYALIADGIEIDTKRMILTN